MQLVPSPQVIPATYFKAKEPVHGVDVVVIVDVVVAVCVVVDVDAVTAATFSSPLSPVR